jgi:hypothetical protein
MSPQTGGSKVDGADPADADGASEQAQLDALLCNLDPDPQRAGERYVILWGRLEKFFERRRCIDTGALVDTCLTLLGNRLQKIKVESIESYAFGIALRVYRAYLRKAKRQLTEGDQGFKEPFIGDADPGRTLQEGLDAEKLRNCIELCIRGLSTLERETLASWSGDDAPGLAEARGAIAEKLGIRECDLSTAAAKTKLAKELGISEGALKKRAHDIRTKLRFRVSNCMKGRKRK